MADEADRLIAALAAGDEDAVRLLLHPYLHWQEGPTRVRGRTKVLALLAGRRTLARPDSCEARDGQIYRWSGPGPA